MSNILIIKHGSLGDIVQISGALLDIRSHFKNKKIYILTTSKYKNLFEGCPYVDEVLIDKRLPRWNFFYLLNLIKDIRRLNFENCFDLQNSSRTDFYRKNFSYIYAIKKLLGKFFKSFFKSIFYLITFRKNQKNKYLFRFLGLLNAILGRSSSFRG